MKYAWSPIIFAILIFSTSATWADQGCIDNSRHMQSIYDATLHREYDNKEYRRVWCTCPCAKRYKLSPDRGRCMQCLHYHIPQPFNILWPENSIHAPSKKVVAQARKHAVLTKPN